MMMRMNSIYMLTIAECELCIVSNTTKLRYILRQRRYAASRIDFVRLFGLDWYYDAFALLIRLVITLPHLARRLCDDDCQIEIFGDARHRRYDRKNFRILTCRRY